MILTAKWIVNIETLVFHRVHFQDILTIAVLFAFERCIASCYEAECVESCRCNFVSPDFQSIEDHTAIKVGEVVKSKL